MSDFVRNRLTEKRRLSAERVITILNGIDLDRFRPYTPTHKDGLIRIFAGSRASRYKGIQVLIEAIALLRDEHGIDHVRVRYAGDGNALPNLKALADQLQLGEVFEFLGEVGSTQGLLAESDIAVVPSIWGDACPSSVSEAMASGKPLVASAVGGIPEMVGEGGNALLVPHSDPGALATALASLILSPSLREKLGRKGRERAKEALDRDMYHATVTQQLLSDLRLSRGHT